MLMITSYKLLSPDPVSFVKQPETTRITSLEDV
jgi:hypothetical protein